MSSYQEYTEQEIRENINGLIDANGTAELYRMALTDLADELHIQLEPKKIELEGNIFAYDNNAITVDDEHGFYRRIPRILDEEFGERWQGTKVKLTIEEVVE